MYYKLPLVLGIIILSVISSGCNKIDLYQKLKWFPDHAWASNDTARFNFTISDSSYYKIYFIMRHSDAYHFNNIWLDMQVSDPDTTYQLKREFILASSQQWLGSGMGDVYEHRIAFSNEPSRFKPGNYSFKLTQAMREDPLESVANVGIRLERQVQ